MSDYRQRVDEVLRNHGIGAFNGTQVACDECNLWMKTAEWRAHQVQKLADAGLLMTPEREQEIRFDEREKRAQVIEQFDLGAGAAVRFLRDPRVPLSEADIRRGQEIARLIAEEATP